METVKSMSLRLASHSHFMNPDKIWQHLITVHFKDLFAQAETINLLVDNGLFSQNNASQRQRAGMLSSVHSFFVSDSIQLPNSHGTWLRFLTPMHVLSTYTPVTLTLDRLPQTDRFFVLDVMYCFKCGLLSVWCRSCRSSSRVTMPHLSLLIKEWT